MMQLVSVWYIKATDKWVTYSSEFNSYAEAWGNR